MSTVACHTSQETTLPFVSDAGVFTDVAEAQVADQRQQENDLLASLVSARRVALAQSESAFRAKVAAERETELHRLNDVLERMLVVRGVL